MNDLGYWEECILDAAEECGLEMTPEQHKAMAEAVSSAHECYSMSFGAPVYSHSSETEDLKRKLRQVETAAHKERADLEDAARRERVEIRTRMGERIENLRADLEAEREANRKPGFASKYR